MKQTLHLRLEQLEDRCTPTTFGNPWPDASHLTLSFPADGTQIGPYQNQLSKLLNVQVSSNSAAWQRTILRAFQTWAVNANVNLTVVADGGQPFGTGGAPQGDARFGDVRVGAYPLASGGELAFEEPFDAAAGTWAGDLSFSSSISYNPNQAGSYDLFSVALHEAGHVFGLDHSADPNSPMYESYGGVRTGLTPGDIANLQALYGSRQPDSLEGSQGNNTFATATPIVVLDGLNLSSTQADVTTLNDKDFFKLAPLASIGSFSVQLQTTGISSALLRLSVYNSRQQLIGSVAASDPQHGDLSIHVNAGLLSGAYYFKVESATTDVFGTGSYQLQVKPDFALNLGTVVNTATNLLINVDTLANDTLASALPLPQLFAQTNSQFDYAYKASISSSSDVDDYLVKAPAPPSGTQNVMTVMVWALQNGGLDPKALLYDALGNPVAANVLSHENNTWVLQVPNAAANAAYYVSVSAADPSGTHNIGNYFLGVDFSTVATNLKSLVSNGPSSGAASATPSLALTANTDLLFHFVLSVDGTNAPAGAAVQMSVYDQDGLLTNTLIVNAGDSRSLTLFLAKGSYTFRFNFINRNGGPVTPLLYRLAGIDLSDPVNPYPSDPTSDPAGSSGTPPSGSGSTVTAPSQPPDGSYGTSTF